MEPSATAKIILFGEHAVVYGQPAIAVPVTSIRARVQIKRTAPGAGLVIRSPGTRQTFHVRALGNDPSENSLEIAAQLTLKTLGYTTLPDLTLTLHSEIALGRGLGSGAAVSTALVRALCVALSQDLSKEQINEIVFEVEKKHHGTPSGIDNTVIVYEKPIYFVRGQPLESFTIKQPFTLLVADSGFGTPTHVTVGEVRRLYETKPERTIAILERIGEISKAARAAMESGEIRKLGPLMNENHDLLQRLTVSSIELDLLCETALAAGAMGAKLSGGGRGGNIIALVTNSQAERITEALHRAGATRVVKTRVRSAV